MSDVAANEIEEAMRTRSADGRSRPKEADQWECVVAAAYRTACRDDSVTAVYVVLPRRPTYREMLRFRNHERSGEIRMGMPLHDCVCIRTQSAGAKMSTARAAPGIAPGVQRSELNGRRDVRQPAWMHQLLTMTEGVR